VEFFLAVSQNESPFYINLKVILIIFFTINKNSKICEVTVKKTIKTLFNITRGKFIMSDMNVFNVLGNTFSGASNAASLMSAVADGLRRQAETVYTQIQQNANNSALVQALTSQYTNINNTAAALSSSALDQTTAVSKKLIDTYGASTRLLA